MLPGSWPAADPRSLRPVVRSVLEADELDGAALAAVSATFGPLLPSFVRETLRHRGAVRLAVAGRSIVGLALDDPPERSATVFGRDPVAVKELARPLGSHAVFSELPLPPVAESYRLLRADPARAAAHRFRHPVRPADAAELPTLLARFHGAVGRADEPWAEALRGSEEVAFVAEVDGRAAGVAWLLVAGTHARLHSVWVAPRYRGIGVGTDLVAARLLWAGAAGARSALCEIATTNGPSLAAATRAGFAPAGEMYLRVPP